MFNVQRKKPVVKYLVILNKKSYNLKQLVAKNVWISELVEKLVANHV